MSFFGHLNSIHHHWQMTSLVPNINMQHKINMAIALTVFLIQDIKYAQYRPAIQFDRFLVSIPVLIQSLWVHSSQVTDDGLCHKHEHATEQNNCVHCNNGLFLIQEIVNDQYRPAMLFDTLLVPTSVLLQSLWPHSSPKTNDDMCDQYGHATLI
jgi:hypothetical protein